MKNLDVGKRLQDIRTEHGLSQRKLAAMAGVNNSLISLIEKNRTSPSIASLKLILDAIPMSFAEFFDVSEINPAKFVYRAAEMPEINPLKVLSGESDADGISFRRVGRSNTHALQMLFETYEPGADTGVEMYSHEAEEAGVVISGQIELTVDGEVEVLRKGDGYIFDSRKPHRFRNIRKTRCTIVSACTPPTF
mgnify:CR=1 FL=1